MKRFSPLAESKSRMRIMHFLPYLTIGGVEIHLLILCKYLKKLGYDPVVVTLNADYDDGARPIKEEFEKNSIPVYDLKLRGKLNVNHIFRISGLIKRLKPQILHTHLPRSDFSGAILTTFFNRRVPWVSSVHDVHSNSWSKKRLLPLLGRVWSGADLTIAISHKVKSWLVDDMKVPESKVKVIHYGIELENYENDSERKKDDPEKKGRCLIGSVGRLEARKGHDILIKAMPEVIKNHPDALLLIAGHDPWGYGEELSSLITKLNLDKHVRLVGFQGDVPAFIHSLDIFAFASFSEGFGLVNIEAMATGTPVVTTDISPMTEIIESGKSGVLAALNSPGSFAESIIRLLNNPVAAEAIGKRGTERVKEKFSASIMAENMVKTYRLLAK